MGQGSGSAPAPGTGSTDPRPYLDAFNRIGGKASIGDPINQVHVWGNGCNQDFTGGWSGKGAIMQPGCSGPAYYVVYRQWAYLEAAWGSNAPNVIGYPSGDDFRWGNGWAQRFQGGTHENTVLARSDQTGSVRMVWGGILHFWQNLQGGGAGSLGLPLSEEYGWNGVRRQDFQGGSVLWDAVNKARLLSSTPAPPAVPTREQKAVEWALAEAGSPNPAWSDQLGRCWSGWCESYVEIAFGTIRQYTNAYVNYQTQKAAGRVSTSGTPPKGAMVFYNAVSGGINYGHIGISLGDGTLVSTVGWLGDCTNVQVHAINYFGGYLGWSMAPDGWPGR